MENELIENEFFFRIYKENRNILSFSRQEILDYGFDLLNKNWGETIIVLVDQKSTEEVISGIIKLIEGKIKLLFITSNKTKTINKLIEKNYIKIKVEDKNISYLSFSNKNDETNYKDLNGIIFETSGTTGDPKYVLQSRKSLLNTAKDIIFSCKIKKNISEIIYSPRSSAFFVVRVVALWLVNGKLHLSEKTNYINILSILSMDAINSFSADTPVWDLLLENNRTFLEKISSKLIWAKLSSANPSKHNKNLLKMILGKTIIVLGYGLSEYMRATFQIINMPGEVNNNDFDSVGIASRNTEIKLLNNSFEKNNKEGEILIKGSHIANTYLFADKLWNSKIYNEYFCTGDIGLFNDKGELFIVGRKDNISQIGGFIEING